MEGKKDLLGVHDLRMSLCKSESDAATPPGNRRRSS